MSQSTIQRLIFVISLLFPLISFGQKVRVVDKNTMNPVYNAAVIDGQTNDVVFSDEDGYLELKATTDPKRKLYVRHPSYKRQELTYKDLSKQNNVIYLSEGVLNIDEIVVSANKWEQEKSEVPNEILSISPREVAFKNPQTAADMLENTGQVFMQRSQMGGGSPMIRGFAANSVLIMVDGVRMNNAIYREGNLQNVIMLDPNLLERSEVIYGPGSVLYGSDALGGVMDFNTLRPRYSTGDKLRIYPTAFVRYASANNENTGHVNLRYGNKNWGFITGLSYSDFGDLRSGANRNSKYPDFGKRYEYVTRVNGADQIIQNDDQNIQRFSGYNQTNFLQKTGYTKDTFELLYGFYYTTSSNIPRYDRLTERSEGQLKSAEWYYGPQEFMMHSLTLSDYKQSKMYDAVKLVLAHQNVTESRNDRKLYGDDLRKRNENVKTYSLNLDLDKKLNEKTELFYGAEVLHNTVTSTAFSVDITNPQSVSAASTRYPDGGSSYGSLATYFSLKRRMWSDVIVTGGIRYSNVYMTSKFEDKTFYDFQFDRIKLNNDAISGSLGLVYLKDDKWKLSGLLSSGFRSPNIDDIGKVFDSEPGNVVVPNENLQPEFSYNSEISLTRNIANVVEVEMVGYYSFLKETIARRDFTFNNSSTITYDGVESNVQALVNVGDAYIFGYSLNVRADITHYLSLYSTLSNNSGKDKIENVPLRHTTPLFGQTSFIFNLKKVKAELFARYNGSKSKKDFVPSELNKDYLYTVDGSPSWTTLNFRSSYQLTSNLSMSAAIENMFDVHYRPYSSGISAPGRNVILSVKAQF
ncbi:TonB-dependent receptor [Reichenbachiella sp. MALMAid0571]|uniref:TonB-dependent receptor n=1 Tax=Reichenbachiella sp. MALMAid0571 TaxID=3143939 RepID=UPI0032DF2CCE